MAVRRLGEILLSAGLITEDQLQQAIEEQKRTGLRLGESLVALGFATEEDVARTVADQTGITFVPESQLQIDYDAARLLSEAVARQYRAIPLAADEDSVTVALDDPIDVFKINDISFLIGRNVTPVIVTAKALDRLMAEVFRPRPQEPAGQVAGLDENLQIELLESPAVKYADELIQTAIEEGASDIHIEPLDEGVRVRFRIDGVLHNVASPPIDIYPALISRLKLLSSMDISERRVPQDGRIQMQYKGREIDLRTSTLPTVHGEKLAIRILDKGRAITRLDDLGFRAETLEGFRRLIRLPVGMVLVTGPTGSGKTTTLTASLYEINGVEKNIVTIEDPVEYLVPGTSQVQVNPRAGLTFAAGLRAFLRQDPDVMVVGEIRDAETAETAVRAALTGHLVLSSLHTNDAPGAVARLIDMGVEPYLVASAISGVLAQRLVRRVCQSCREAYEIPSDAPQRVLMGIPQEVRIFYRGRGCPRCRGTGYRGRTAIFELMTVSSTIREMVMAKVAASQIRQQALAEGMVTLVQDGVWKAMEGLTTLEEVQRVALLDT